MTMNLLPLTKKSYLNVSYSIRTLYTSKHKASNYHDTTVFFEHGNDNVLHDYEQKACEVVLTEKECLEALKDMESDKTPGTDGLPAEFYKVFWKDISTILIKSLNFVYGKDQLPVTQRRGIIKLIPNKDAEPYYILLKTGDL